MTKQRQNDIDTMPLEDVLATARALVEKGKKLNQKAERLIEEAKLKKTREHISHSPS